MVFAFGIMEGATTVLYMRYHDFQVHDIKLYKWELSARRLVLGERQSPKRGVIKVIPCIGDHIVGNGNLDMPKVTVISCLGFEQAF